MRQQVVEAGGLLIIDDSYNASPDSMRSAIDVLATRPVTGKRAAVLAAGGTIILPRQAGGSVTFALALRPFAPDWRWQDA